MKPRQSDVFLSPSRFRSLAAGRRWGKTYLAVAECLAALVNPLQELPGGRGPKFPFWRPHRRPRRAIYVAPTYRQAKDVAWEEAKRITRDFWARKPFESELKIVLRGEHILQLYGAENYDRMRGPGNDFAVIDEYADIDPDAWELVIRHTLADRGGAALFIGCVNKGTMVLSARGMTPIGFYDRGSPEKTLRPLDEPLYGLDRTFHQADGFWHNGVVPTKKIVTGFGFELEASLPHPVLVMGEDGASRWKKSEDLEIGDRIAIARGMEVWPGEDPCIGFDAHIAGERRRRRGRRGPKPRAIPALGMSADLAYFLGLWVAEGSAECDTGRITITCGDPSVGDFLRSAMPRYGITFKQRGNRTDQWAANSYEFVAFMSYLEMSLTKAPEKRLPGWVSRGKREWAAAFIAGAWDGDGHCDSNRCRLGYSTASRELASGLQLLLTNFGIVARRSAHDIGPTERVKVPSRQHRLTVTGTNVGTFRSAIPLRILRKQHALGRMKAPAWSRRDGVPHQDRLLRKVRNGLRRRDSNVKSDRNSFSAALDHGCDISYRSLGLFVETHASSQLGALEVLRKNNAGRYYWDRVASLEDGRCDTFDFTIPETHSFWSNGFISHNTPKGFNHFYDQHQKAKEREYWAAFQYTTAQGGLVPASEIALAEADMSPLAFRQELRASFENLLNFRAYYAFSDSNVVRLDFDPELDLLLCCDFNISPMSWLLCQRIGDGSDSDLVHVLDEIVVSETSTPAQCRQVDVVINKLLPTYMSQVRLRIYGDASGANRNTSGAPSDMWIMKKHFGNQPIYRASFHFDKTNPLQRDRVSAVNRLLGNIDEIAYRKRLLIDPRCRELTDDLRQVAWASDSHRNPTGGLSKVDPKRGHISDALGYYVNKDHGFRSAKGWLRTLN